MVIKKSQGDDFGDQKAEDLVSWGSRYETGIASIDKQHRELVSLTNRLYRACRVSRKEAEAEFKTCMSSLVEYVRFHFGSEQALLERIHYPKYYEHKKSHEDLILKILEAAKEYSEGKLLVPNNFVRTLSDWISGHIAIEDKVYSEYVEQLKKQGVLSDRDIEENTTAV